MDKKLRTLFDYQRFAGNSRLEGMIAEAERNNIRELSMDELGMVNAAGQNVETVVNLETRTNQFERSR